MAGMVENLQKTLNEQLQCYEALNTLAKQKQTCLMYKNVDELKIVVQREEEFIGRILVLDKQARGSIKDLALVLGVRNKNFKLEEVIERCDAEERAVLTELRKQIVQKMDTLKRQNDVNTVMINQSLELINFSIAAMHSHKGVQPIGYEHLGEMQIQGTNTFFDKKQ